MTKGHILTDGHLDMTNCHTILTNSSFRSDQKSSPNDFFSFGHMGMTLFGRVSGCLNQILQLAYDIPTIVQVLVTKNMKGNRVRAVIYDGEMEFSRCVFISEDIQQMNNDGVLSKYTVLRLDQYLVSSKPEKPDMP